jgi:hypothetical protein
MQGELRNSRMELKLQLFRAMGFDLGTIHGADQHAEAILPRFRELPSDWLHTAAKKRPRTSGRILIVGLENEGGPILTPVAPSCPTKPKGA